MRDHDLGIILMFFPQQVGITFNLHAQLSREEQQETQILIPWFYQRLIKLL